MKKLFSLAGIFALMSTLTLNAQVTIGTLIPPLKGVLLDLKQQTETDGAVNSTNGMKFPRIALNGLTSLQPMLSSSEDDAATAATKLQYKGMIVYNVTVNAGANLQEGLYVWDGTQWEVLQTGNDAANRTSMIFWKI